MEKSLQNARDSAAKPDPEFEKSEAALEAAHRAHLADTNFTSGRAAAERHAQEWKRRESHDPELAASWLEKSLVEAEKLGRNSEVAAEVALRNVATMVSPQGSRIEVTPSGERFIVRVAFRLSAVMPDEAGGVTRHTNSLAMRREIEDVTARVVKNIFDFCGSRGIQSLSVSCNRALTEGRDDGERLAMRSLFRVAVSAEQAADVSSWRSIPLPQVARLWRVDRDTIGNISFTRSAPSQLRIDPDEPLEF